MSMAEPFNNITVFIKRRLEDLALVGQFLLTLLSVPHTGMLNLDLHYPSILPK
jgi:hypothetical protein